MKYSYDIETLENQVFGEELVTLPEPEEDGQEAGSPAVREDLDSETEVWDLDESEDVALEEGAAPIVMTLTLEDGSQMECQVAGVFLEGEKEYIALETPEGRIHIMELGQEEEDGINLISVEEEEEQERVIETFIRLFGGEELESETMIEKESNLEEK